MSEAEENEGRATVPAAVNGEAQDEPIYFAYSATLRIFGAIPDLDGLTQRLGINPTRSHRRGELRTPESSPYKHDMWMYTAPIGRSEPLHMHIDGLWSTFRERKEYLLQLKTQVTVDVFLGYRSNCDNAGVEVRHQSLAMFLELELPFCLSIIVE